MSGDDSLPLCTCLRTCKQMAGYECCKPARPCPGATELEGGMGSLHETLRQNDLTCPMCGEKPEDVSKPEAAQPAHEPPATVTLRWCPACGVLLTPKNHLVSTGTGRFGCDGVPQEVTYDLRAEPQ